MDIYKHIFEMIPALDRFMKSVVPFRNDYSPNKDRERTFWSGGTYRRKPAPVADKKAPPHIYRKQHHGESLADFAARRAVCNDRRRKREKARHMAELLADKKHDIINRRFSL